MIAVPHPILSDVNAVLISLHELLYEIHLFSQGVSDSFCLADQSKQPRQAVQVPAASVRQSEERHVIG